MEAQTRETVLAQRGGLGFWIEVSGQVECGDPRDARNGDGTVRKDTREWLMPFRIGLCYGPLEVKQYCCCCGVENRVYRLPLTVFQ